jgi:CDP-4-dehydro-6-deoxyglucose reductase
MERLLSVAKAARLAGVSRRTIQKEIQSGTLATFEGKVSIADLIRVYPEIEVEDSAMLERLSRIQANAVHKKPVFDLPNEQRLAGEVDRLRLELADAKAEIRRYQDLLRALQNRLIAIKEAHECSRQQKLIIQALLRWMLNRLDGEI